MVDDTGSQLTIHTAWTLTGATGARISGDDPAAGSWPMTTVRVHGEVDLATRDTFDAALEQVVAGADGPILIDLSGMGFCDAGGLGLLMRTTARAADRGLDLGLIGLAPRLARLCAELWPGPQPVHYPTIAATVALPVDGRPARGAA